MDYKFATLQDAVFQIKRFCITELPPDWALELEFTTGELQITLVDSDGRIVEKYCPASLTVKGTPNCVPEDQAVELVGAVAHARFMQDLDAVWNRIERLRN